MTPEDQLRRFLANLAQAVTKGCNTDAHDIATYLNIQDEGGVSVAYLPGETPQGEKEAP